MTLGSDGKGSAQTVSDLLSRALSEDGVMQDDFLKGICLINDPHSSLETSNDLKDSLHALFGQWTTWFKVRINPLPISGPSFRPGLVNNYLFRDALRLREDTNSAFMLPVAPQTSYSRPFVRLGLSGDSPDTLIVATTSHFVAPLSSERPLAGLRVAVKDIFDMHGLRTSACNRAWVSVAQPATSTALCVQRLMAAGAVVVGTTKCSSLLSREEPTEAVDYQAPFNPRGDGYQSPAGSSSGSAAAIAAYEWLDISIGSDSARLDRSSFEPSKSANV